MCHFRYLFYDILIFVKAMAYERENYYNTNNQINETQMSNTGTRISDYVVLLLIYMYLYIPIHHTDSATYYI